MSNNPLSLTGRVALVTGAGQGVGRQIALTLAENGCDVLINDFFEDRARLLADEIANLGRRAVPIAGDVTDFEAVRSWLPKAAAEAGGLDIVVNNAGNAGPQGDASEQPKFWETEPSDWARWLGTNLYGVLNVCRAATPLLIERGKGGSIINIISDAGRVGEAGLAVYSGAKAGVAGFSRALAKELGRHRVRVNCVSLSAIMTPGVAAIISDPEVLKRVTRAYPLGRIGTPEDPSNLVLFLASDASTWITAQTYPVNGGFAVSQ
ncbi:MAG: SDR family oxidoreductase [Caulobacteraceae bacterium]|nr:SDR family oxidoreductase [Caulobacteraceae bacterium]